MNTMHSMHSMNSMHSTPSFLPSVLLALGALVAPLSAPLCAQITFTITTDLSGPTVFTPTPHDLIGPVAYYADQIVHDDLLIEYVITGCDLGPPRLLSVVNVRSLTSAPRDVEIVISQPAAPLQRPTFVTASTASTVITLLGGGSMSDLNLSPIFQSELDGNLVFQSANGPFMVNEPGVSASLFGSATTAAPVAGTGGLGELRFIMKFSAEGEIAVSVAAVLRVHATGVPDMNGSGVIDGADLGLLLDSWGRTTAFGPGDLNGDGHVDGADLGLLLSEFGSVVGCG